MLTKADKTRQHARYCRGWGLDTLNYPVMHFSSH